MNSRKHQQHYIDLDATAFDPSRVGARSPGDLPSPRSGEVPPALSPLDAFALQGRLLAQRLEAGNNGGRRMSRLPPLTIANALAQPRPGYFGNSAPLSAHSEQKSSPASGGTDGSGTSAHVSQPSFRPKSHYPTIQAFDDAESIISRDSTVPTIKPVLEEEEEEVPYNAATKYSFDGERFIANRHMQSHSPDMLPGAYPEPDGPGIKKQYTSDSITSTGSNNSASFASRPSRSPVPPRSPKGLKNKSSIRSVRYDNGDDSDSLSVHGERFLGDRKPSFGSVYSRPRSPFSPVFAPPRSPSMSSDYSQNVRGSVNFSRPLSRSGRRSFETQRSFDGSVRGMGVESPPTRPSLDVLSLQESIMDSPQLPNAPWTDVGTPLNLTDDESSPRPGTPSGAPTYTYAKYSLPRGRTMSKSSTMQQPEQTYKYEWEQPIAGHSNLQQIRNDTRSFRTRQLEVGQDETSYEHMTASVPDLPKIVRTASANDSIPSSRGLKGHRSNPSFPPTTPSITSTSSGRTLRPAQTQLHPGISAEQRSFTASPLSRSPRPAPGSPMSSMPDAQKLSDSLVQLTPEGHLAKGIACHESGQLQKSTYHLRLAARGGDPTGMLMYALACRHGWGMRPNQEEGVSWLRKAVESAGLEVAEDEAPGSGNKHRGSVLVAAKAHKAQLALAIYELGTSYMNGWGIKSDKTLALRCYEVAGSWGDGDALAEAGFCYAKGVGCKKDLKKAADFYRRAADKGVGMAGNSWIYKDKYMPPPEPIEDERNGRGSEKEKEKRTRDKSRTRTIFGGRKKSIA